MEACKYRAGMQQILADYPILQWFLLRCFVISLSWKMRCFAHREGEKGARDNCGMSCAVTLTEQEASECWQKYIELLMQNTAALTPMIGET